MANERTDAFVRHPTDGHRRDLVLVVALLVVTLASLDLMLQRLGVQPSFGNEPGPWAVERERALDPAAFVLVGSPRFQLALDPAEIQKRLPNHTVSNLSVLGQSPLPVLEDLAHDPKFRGVVLFEFHPWRMYTRDDADIEKSRRFVDAYHRRPWISDLEHSLRAPLQASLTFLNPEYNLKWAAHQLIASAVDPTVRFQAQQFQRVLANRHAPRDFEGWNALAYSAQRVAGWKEEIGEAALDEQQIDRRMSDIETWTSMIRGRGGRVIFLRSISYGPTRAFERDHFPREQRWDRFASTISDRAFHFEDMGLGVYDCPDDSHMDWRDSARYSADLVEALVEAGAIERGK